jgi:hypothetical protein
LAALALLVAVPMSYSTARGLMTWYFPSGGAVMVDGVSNGYLHKSWRGTAAIITRTDSKPNQSYFVGLPTSKNSQSVFHCGAWRAPRFLPIAIGDVNPPCLSSLFEDSEPNWADPPISATLSIRPGFVEFSTTQGKKVKASW